MSATRRPLAALAHAVHRHFLGLLIGSYVLAGLAPDWGLAVRAATLGHVALGGQTTRVALPVSAACGAASGGHRQREPVDGDGRGGDNPGEHRRV
jgi:hypothetical protein